MKIAGFICGKAEYLSPEKRPTKIVSWTPSPKRPYHLLMLQKPPTDDNMYRGYPSPFWHLTLKCDRTVKYQQAFDESVHRERQRLIHTEENALEGKRKNDSSQEKFLKIFVILRDTRKFKAVNKCIGHNEKGTLS